jgi:hypothetical protein
MCEKSIGEHMAKHGKCKNPTGMKGRPKKLNSAKGLHCWQNDTTGNQQSAK